MNKTIKKLVIIIILILIIGAVVAGINIYLTYQKTHLIGEYVSKNAVSQVVYTFEDDNKIKIDMLMGGYNVYSQTGTYEISKNGDEITISIDKSNSTILSSEMTNIGGTFKYEKGENYIIIGDNKYELRENTNDTNSSNNDEISKNEEIIPLSDIELKLPDYYSIQYDVKEENVVSRTYSQSMIQTDKGIYLNLEDSGEKYVFEKLSNGKYLKYQYNSLTGKYENSSITQAIQEQIDKGNLNVDVTTVDENTVSGFTTRLTTYFDYYKTIRSSLNYQGQEKIGDKVCQKYTASISNASGKQVVELWIEPVSGLCIKGIYNYEPLVGSKTTKTIECTEIQTENVKLPEYR